MLAMPKDPEEPAYLLREGDVYEGFSVLRRIGCGGFGQVYLVRDPSGRRWALKLFVPVEAKDRAAVARNRTAAHRFLMEAAILQSIKNMHVVRCERHGQAADGSLWLLLEYLPGNSLRRELEVSELGRMPMERVLRIGYQLASALFVIHGRGVVHRDIKPENVMILPGDIAKVLDFGVAKAHGASASFRTTGAVHYGTGLYMAPDRLMSMSGDASPLWDIYSTGLTLWEMADGQHPFFRKAGMQLTDAQVIHMHMGGRAIPSLAESTGHDAEVCEAVMRACAPDPRDRFQSAEEMMNALEDALARERQLSTDRVDPLGQNVTGRTRARITAAITEPSLAPSPAPGAAPIGAAPRWTKTEPIVGPALVSPGAGKTERIVTPAPAPAPAPKMAPVPTAHVLRELGRPGLTAEEEEAVGGLHPAEQRYRVLFLRYLDSQPPEAAIDMDRIGTAIADYVEATQVAATVGEREEARPAAIDDRWRELFGRVPGWLAVVLVVASLAGLAAVLWWRAGGSAPAVVDPPASVPVQAPSPGAPLPEPKKK